MRRFPFVSEVFFFRACFMTDQLCTSSDGKHKSNSEVILRPDDRFPFSLFSS